MNPTSDLPKPTPPVKTDDSNQSVVFDQNDSNAKTTVPLAMKSPVDLDKADDADTNSDLNSTGDTTKPADATPPVKTMLPPTSLSALSSMSSNRIPSASNSSSPTGGSSLPQKTVLGQPIPQTIRGESAPSGFNSGIKKETLNKQVPPKILEQKYLLKKLLLNIGACGNQLKL